MLTKKDFLSQLEKLVGFKSLPGDKATNADALDYIQTLIAAEANVERIRNGKAEILLAGNTKSLTPSYGYLVHVDVVAASESLFKMTKKNGIVAGRGVSDMKFSIPIGIALLNELIALKSRVSFSLAITTDEEVGGYEGALFLAREKKWRPKVLIVPDGGDNLNFVNKAKGIVQFEIVSRGASAHASRPWQGQNAIPALAKLVVALEERYGQNAAEENWNTTVNYGIISGGISTNQVCDLASLKLDFRFPETTSVEAMEAGLRELAGSIDRNLEINRLSYGMPTFTDVNNQEVHRFLQILGNKFGKKVAVKPTYGASDARHFAPLNIPVLMIKPEGGDIHCETEWLDVDSAMTFYEALREYLA